MILNLFQQVAKRWKRCWINNYNYMSTNYNELYRKLKPLYLQVYGT